MASRAELFRACDRTLERLGLDSLDLYLIHARRCSFDNVVVDIPQAMEYMCDLVDAGKVRHIGVCNFNTQSLHEAQTHSKYPIVLNQVHYNLMFRECERLGLVQYCQQNDTILQAW